MALLLNTRHRERQFEADARLIVFDSYSLTSSDISDEVRNLIARRPLTRHIFIAAPFIAGAELENLLTSGGAAVRAAAGLRNDDLRFWMLDLRRVDQELKLQVQDFAAGQADSPQGATASGTWKDVHQELVEGWLFNLFDSSEALVHAPAGVHFTKSSGKHSTVFLRTSNTLLSSAACGILAMVALARLNPMPPRRMFVDTAPLLSIAYAMSAVAQARGFWSAMAPVQSFSSYGGKDKLPRLTLGDIVLVSASTSGGLAKDLLDKGVHEHSLLTLYFLASEPGQTSKGAIACDLTIKAERTFGYQPIKSYKAQGCPICEQGFVKAELEGDQFLLDRRSVKRLRLLRSTQQAESRELFEKTARASAWEVSVYAKPTGRTNFELRRDAVLSENGVFAEDFARLLERYAPTPLDLVVCCGLSAKVLQAVAARYGVSKVLDGAEFLDQSELDTRKWGPSRRNALVAFDVLQDHSLARTVNAALRGVCNGGNVAYIAALAVAETARSAKDLEVFLTFGSRGADTFTFKAAGRILLPYNTEEASPWDKERALLQRLQAGSHLPALLQTRLQILQQAGVAHDNLFLPALAGHELKVSPDFVFLDTNVRPADVSQGDIYAIVSNVLACARAGADNADLDRPPIRTALTPAWRQTSLFQTLLCPSNFKDFNDAVLRAALLRGATEQEMNYVLDDLLSAEMLDVLVGQVQSSNGSAGDALPEFLLALASGRLRLTRSHTVQLRYAINAAALPEYVAPIVSAITET